MSAQASIICKSQDRPEVSSNKGFDHQVNMNYSLKSGETSGSVNVVNQTRVNSTPTATTSPTTGASVAGSTRLSPKLQQTAITPSKSWSLLHPSWSSWTLPSMLREVSPSGAVSIYSESSTEEIHRTARKKAGDSAPNAVQKLPTSKGKRVR